MILILSLIALFVISVFYLKRKQANAFVAGPTSYTCYPMGTQLLEKSKPEEAIATWEKCLPQLDPKRDKTEIARIELGLGTAHFLMYEYSESIPHLEKSISSDNLSDEESLTDTFHMLGAGSLWLGRYNKAMEYFDKEWELRGDKPASDKHIIALYERARAYVYLNRYRDSEEALKESMKLAEYLKDDNLQAWSHLGFGRLYGYLNRPEDAHVSLKNALKLASDDALKADAFMNLGAELRRKGKYDEAIKFYETATQHALKDSRAAKLLIPRIHIERSMALYRNKQFTEAQAAISEALPKLEENEDMRYQVMAHAALGTTHSLGNRPEYSVEPFKNALKLLDRMEDQLLRAQIANNAAVAEVEIGNIDGAEKHFQQAALDFEAARNDLPSSEARKLFMGNLPKIYANWAAINIYKNHIPTAFEIIERGRAKSFMDLLETSYASSGSQVEKNIFTRLKDSKPGVSFADLVEPIEENATLVEYFHPGPIKIHGQIKDELWIFVVTKQQIELVKVPLSQEALGIIIGGYRSVIRQGASLPVSGTVGNKYFVDPIVKKIGTNNLLIVPYGGMSYLPVSAFWIEAMPDINISILPSAQSLRLIAGNNRSQKNSMLILANPTSNNVALPGAEAEGRRIRSFFPAAELFIRNEATESSVKKLKTIPDVLHFATHGMFDPINPLASFLTLASDIENDGQLTTQEIFDLNLKGISLVTLSACKTGISQVSYGDDNMGMLQAFLVAGTPSLIASLWDVDDEATEQFMADFYDSYRTQGSKAVAIRHARRRMENYPEWNTPSHWAAFQLYGAL